MASIQKRLRQRKPSYFVVFRIDSKQKWLYAGKRRIDAERLKAKVEHDLHRGLYQDTPHISFDSLTEKFLESHAHRVRERTLDSYRGHLEKRIIPFFKGRKLTSIRPVDVEAFLSALKAQGVSPSTTAKYLKTLKTVLKKACEWGYLAKSPAEYVKPVRVERKEMDCLAPAEIEKLIWAADERHRALVMLSCYTGLRQSEALGLCWDDIDFQSNRILVRRTWQKGKFHKPKTRASGRFVPIPPVLSEALRQHQLRQLVEIERNEHNLVFANERGNPLDKSNLNNRILKPALARAGLRQVRWHDLRHSFATALLSRGESLKFVQVLLGHSTPSITLDVYSHVLPETEANAGERIEAILKAV